MLILNSLDWMKDTPALLRGAVIGKAVRPLRIIGHYRSNRSAYVPFDARYIGDNLSARRPP